MWCAASVNEYLSARDARHAALLDALAAGASSTLFFSLNIPGEDKNLPGTSNFFDWGSTRLRALLPGLREVRTDRDLLGPWALFHCDAGPACVKGIGVLLESANSAGRLLDLDVFDPLGKGVGRRELDLPPRRCLLCDEPAVDCIRLRRHDYHLLTDRVHVLLRPFRS